MSKPQSSADRDVKTARGDGELVELMLRVLDDAWRRLVRKMQPKHCFRIGTKPHRLRLTVAP